MKKIEAVIRPDKLDEIKEALNNHHFNGLTISQVMGCGMQKGKKVFYRGTETIIDLLPKVKLEVVTKDENVESIVNIITETARTGEIGDGKIFIYNVEEAVRIRTGERGDNAL